jgi:hypothetical protein
VLPVPKQVRYQAAPRPDACLTGTVLQFHQRMRVGVNGRKPTVWGEAGGNLRELGDALSSVVIVKHGRPSSAD